MGRFSGKTAFVTGSGSGIGAATARRLYEDGANIVLADLSIEAAEATIRSVNGAERMFAVAVDVSKPAEVAEAFSKGKAKFGQIEYLVNAAGIRGVGTVVDSTQEMWDRNMGVNLAGSFNTCQSYAQAAREANLKGAIVNISSQAGLEGLPNRLPYVTSKHGVVGLTRAVAMDLAPHGIRVNAVAPGVIHTNFTASLLENRDIAERMAAAHPIGRVGKPEEIAAVISFLLSEEASFMTGSIVAVDGGITAGAASF